MLPAVREAEATIREVMSTCSNDRPIDMNCQPSSRTMMPRAMPANSRAAFPGPVQERVGAGDAERRRAAS